VEREEDNERVECEGKEMERDEKGRDIRRGLQGRRSGNPGGGSSQTSTSRLVIYLKIR
jgi:hypothetical protein